MNYYPPSLEELGTNNVDSRPPERPIHRPTRRPTLYLQENRPEETYEIPEDRPFYDQRPNTSGKHKRDINLIDFFAFWLLRLLYHCNFTSKINYTI